MRRTIIRLLLIGALFLFFQYVVHWKEPLLLAFVITYILEPAIIKT